LINECLAFLDLKNEHNDHLVQDPLKMLTKRDILKIAERVTSGSAVEEVVKEFEQGNFPTMDNMLQQMALISLTKDLGGHIFIEKQYILEALKTGNILREDVFTIGSM
jgi:hypothetical protein